MTDDLTLGLKPKKYKCSNGHKWEDPPGTSSLSGGWTFNFHDPRFDKAHEMSLKLGPYCNICLHERLKTLLADVGVVQESDRQ